MSAKTLKIVVSVTLIECNSKKKPEKSANRKTTK